MFITVSCLHFRDLAYLCLRVYKLFFIYMREGLRTWHRVNSAADRVKPSWRTAVGSSLSKDSPVLSLCRVRPWLFGWPLSIFLPTPGYCPWILRTTSPGESSLISLYLPSNMPRVPKWVYSNSFFAIHYMQMRVLFHTIAITGGICISLELMVLICVPAIKIIQSWSFK